MFLCMNCCIESANWIADIFLSAIEFAFSLFCHSLFIVYVFILRLGLDEVLDKWRITSAYLLLLL